MEQYLEPGKQSPEELIAELREPATPAGEDAARPVGDRREGGDRRDRRRDRGGDRRRSWRATATTRGCREYLSSRRGRSYLRMTLRNRTLVDALIDRAIGTDDATPEADAAPETPSQNHQGA